MSILIKCDSVFYNGNVVAPLGYEYVERIEYENGRIKVYVLDVSSRERRQRVVELPVDKIIIEDPYGTCEAIVDSLRELDEEWGDDW